MKISPRIVLIKDFVQERCDSPEPGFSEKELLLYAPLASSDIRWNYEKILFNRAGQPYRRYPPATEVMDMVPDIEFLLAKLK